MVSLPKIYQMFVTKDTLTEDAKVWIYPASRKFYPQELEALNEKLRNFVDGWKAEDPEFKASFSLEYQRFIVFFADEQAVLTNADIDAQVSFILELEQTYELVLMDKMNVCFKQGDFVQYKDVKAFKKLLKDKSVSSKTVVFDNLVQNKYEFDTYWEVPITESWYSRFL